MGNETSKAIYEAKKIQNFRKSKLKIQKKQEQQHLNDVVSDKIKFDHVEQGGQMLKKQKSQNSQQTQNQLQNMQEEIIRDQRLNLKHESNLSNPYQVKEQLQKAQEDVQRQQKFVNIKIKSQKVVKKFQHQNLMQNENDSLHQKQVNLKLESSQKELKQSIPIKWQSYHLSQDQRLQIKSKKAKVEVIQISSDEQDSADQSDMEERSLSQIENNINESLQGQQSQSQMIEENEEKSRPYRKVKVEVQQNEEQKKIKLQYTQTKPEDIGVFVWNKQRNIFRQKELSEQQEFLYRLEQEYLKKAPLQPIFTSSGIQQKVYLKSVDILAIDFNYDLFVSIKELQQYQSQISVKIVPDQKNVNVMEDQKNDDQFFMRQGTYANVFFNRRNNYADFVLEGKIHHECRNLPPRGVAPEYKEYWFQLMIQDFKVGKSTIIQNMGLRYQGWQNKLSQYFKSLKFLLSQGIIQIQTTKINPSPYQDIDVQQVNLNTRSSSTPESIQLLKQKKQAQFSASFPLTFNLHNYYKFVVEQKLKKINNLSEQKLFAIQEYVDIFNSLSQQLRIVLNFTNKSKWNETLKNSLLEKWQVFVQTHNEQQLKDDKKQQQDGQNNDMEYVDPPVSNKQGIIKLPNQQINKQELQQLFQSGKWFSLNSKKVPYVVPSKFFNGQLKQYQQLTLGWMLYRENCPVDYKIQRPIQHYLWTEIFNIGQHLYMNKKTHQIMNFLPVWRKNVNGGMLCDEMGLGKTVMALALIDKHVRERKFGIERNEVQAGTLVIVPTTVLLQWQAKINEFLPHMTYLIVSKGKDITKQEVLKSQIVLTTFGIVRSQQKAFHKYHQFAQKPQDFCTIYDFSWLRVIVNEADNLRNFKTFSAKSIQQITKQFTWLLTGTPIQNKLSDLQSYFNLLQFKQHGLIDSSTKKGFIKSQKCLILLKQSLKDIMIRRKKDTLDEFGKPLLLLKEFKWINKVIQFTQQQREIYEYISDKIVKQIEKILEQDVQNQQWSQKMPRLNRKINKKSHQNIEHVFGKLMKLRQFCCHPQLYNSRSNFIKYENFYKHFTYFCQKGYDMNAFKSYGTVKKKYMKDIFKLIFPDAGYIKKQEIKEKIYEDIMSRKDLICTSCSEVIRDGLITICLHPYCQDCFKQEWTNQSKNVQKIKYGDKDIQRRYMICVDGNCQQKIFTRQILHLPRINRFNKKISEILPNKKIRNLIQEVEKTQPYEKIVIYSQFIGMIEIMMQTFERESIKALNLTGRDSIQQRGDKIKAFKQNESIKLLVISTKCGYAGLNLQFANKIYFMQPWWNPAVQDQALGRLHRYGQEKQVQATRFLMNDSIEGIINLAGKQKKLLSDFVLDSDSLKLRKQKFEILKLYKRQLSNNISKNKNNVQQKKQQ